MTASMLWWLVIYAVLTSTHALLGWIWLLCWIGGILYYWITTPSKPNHPLQPATYRFLSYGKGRGRRFIYL